MARFILMVDDKNNGTATLSIYANDGTKSSGFGWEWLGKGMNTGGQWEWKNVSKYFIALKDRHGSYWGFVDAAWSGLENPNGYPPEPWFNSKGINSGTVQLQQLNLESFDWRLK